MNKLPIFLALLMAPYLTAQSIPRTIAQELHAGSRWYWASVAAMAGGSAFDAGTSLKLNAVATPTGIHETNPLLANQQGQFVPQRAIGVKVAVLAATVGCERAVLYLVRRSAGDTVRVEKIFSWVNVAFGAGYTSIGAHNMTLH
jgi:hypothetical protein